MIFSNPPALPRCPLKIVSLVPSITELLADLMLQSEVAGITKFCVHPPAWHREKTRVGGTKNIDLEKLGALQPDLVIANKEENVKEQVEAIGQQYPVWLTDVHTLKGALEMIRDAGIITCREKQATELTSEISTSFSTLNYGKHLRCAYLIWKDPWMTAGGDTFINDILDKAGYKNIFTERNRYPEIDATMLNAGNCDIIFLSSEPYPFREKHLDVAGKFFGDIPVMLVDGEMFSWYGSRLRLVPAYLEGLRKRIHLNFPSLL